ncbi:MAG: endonuclease/exonuclease/phosphatase family protein [Rhizobiaceae bacterium]
MKLVTYNVHFGIGPDGRYDIGRIADAVRDADVIALQEVSRNGPINGMRDMVAELSEALPAHFAVFGAPFRVDALSAVENGRAVTRFFEFGNMLLSRTPILSSRNFLLPRSRTYGRLNLQRGALEAMIATPFGPLRCYSVHLDHSSPAERIAQLRYLLPHLTGHTVEGGAVTGIVEWGFPELPVPEEYVLLGDFNFKPGSQEYLELTGIPDDEYGLTPRAPMPYDAALIGDPDHARRVTWIDPSRSDDVGKRCLDFCFVHASLISRVKRSWIDSKAAGSDHQPVWTELE